jgi:hypothetical protein
MMASRNHPTRQSASSKVDLVIPAQTGNQRTQPTSSIPIRLHGYCNFFSQESIEGLP